METSDHNAFIEAEDYHEWYLEAFSEWLDELEKHILEHGHLSTSAEEVVDEE